MTLNTADARLNGQKIRRFNNVSEVDFQRHLLERDFPTVSSDSFQGSPELSYREQELLRNAKHFFRNLRKQFILQGITGRHSQIIKLKAQDNVVWRSAHTTSYKDEDVDDQVAYTINYCNNLLDYASTGWRVVGITGDSWDVRIDIVNNIPKSE